MTETELLKMKQDIADMTNKLEEFLDVYYRTNFPDKMILTKNLVLNNSNIDTNGTNGMKIGNSGSKLSVYGVTPVVQASAISAPLTPSGTYNSSEAQSAVNAINSIRTAIKNYGITL